MGDPQTGFRLLVVDDEAALREPIARRLRRLRHEVVTAPNADVALELTQLGREPFDVVIIDVHMPPGMSGLDLATMLIERHPTQRIIVMTSEIEEALKRGALARGPVNFLLKPFELFELEAAVAQTLSESSRPDSGHADRVAALARVIAASLPLQTFELTELEVAAWWHDMASLNGANANPVEMAWHSANLLKENGGGQPACAFIRHMHEHWDGSGGPEGLVGDAIPLGAQILLAADAIDHYSEAWVHTGMRPELAAHRAIDLVVRQGGNHFSPHIVALVNENLDALRSICGVARVNSTLEAIA